MHAVSLLLDSALFDQLWILLHITRSGDSFDWITTPLIFSEQQVVWK